MASSVDDKSSQRPSSKQMKLPLTKSTRTFGIIIYSKYLFKLFSGSETSKLPALGSKLRAPTKVYDKKLIESIYYMLLLNLGSYGDLFDWIKVFLQDREQKFIVNKNFQLRKKWI